MTTVRAVLAGGDVRAVLRHLPGQHDQKKHGRGSAGDINSRADMVAWGEERGITVTFGRNDDLVTTEGMRDVAQAIDDMQDKYPALTGTWGDEHPSGWYQGRERGLKELEMGGIVSPGAGAEVTHLSGGLRPDSKMRVGTFDNTRFADAHHVVTDDLYGATVHEMGHVMHRSLGRFNTMSDPGSFDKIVRDARDKVWGRRGAVEYMSDISEYAGFNTREFFGETFAARNVPNIRNSLQPAARNRLDQFAGLVNAAARETYGIKGDVM